MRHSARSLRCITIIITLVLLNFSLSKQVTATPEYSYQTDKPCSYCHEDPNGGGTLTKQGENFENADYVLKEKPTSTWKTPFRLVIGFFHILAALIWFGTIFYIHLFIKPSSFTSGLPLRERVLGWVCIVTVGTTGTILTILKIPSVDKLWTTTFGIVWIVKVSLFVLMVVVAALATSIINKKMRKQAKSRPQVLSSADGKEGRPAYIAYAGDIYDVSTSKLWSDGIHMGRHFAGADLTPSLKDAPHGSEVLERIRKVGKYIEAEKKGPGKAFGVFVFLAYLVLFLMLGIILCVAYWNWGPSLLG